ncbi:MAG: GntR family transcriptional regulator [Gordonia sp. (in: high G+C Gram-positive bacteria)]
MANRLVAQLAETRSGNDRANVVEELRRLILSGGAPPGTHIMPGEVADAFQVSPIPVREALKTLVGEGLVEHRRNSGYRVSRLSLAELNEIYFVRGILEQAALSRAVNNISAADLALARSYHDEMVTATKYQDGMAFHTASRLFHMTLATPCAMLRLLNMFAATWNLTEPFQVMRAVDSDTQVKFNADHAELLAAFTDRDTAAVLEAARAHHNRIEAAIIETGGALHVLDDPGHEHGLRTR